jgi:hypothetical protein
MFRQAVIEIKTGKLPPRQVIESCKSAKYKGENNDFIGI